MTDRNQLSQGQVRVKHGSDGMLFPQSQLNGCEKKKKKKEVEGVQWSLCNRGSSGGVYRSGSEFSLLSRCGSMDIQFSKFSRKRQAMMEASTPNHDH